MVIYKIYGLKVIGEDEIRYIGLTKNSLSVRLRQHKKEQRFNQYKINWILKNKSKIEILLIEDNIFGLENANQKEKYYISLYKSNGNRLTNGTEGGDGTQGVKPWNKGKKCNYVDKLIKNSPKSKKIYCYNLNGDFLKEYRSIKFASIETNISRASINNAINNKYNSKQAGGYQFSYEKSEKINTFIKQRIGITITCIETGEIFNSIAFASKKMGVPLTKMQSIVKDNKFSKSDLISFRDKKILCIETGKCYNSITKAAREMGINGNNISEAIIGIKRKTAGGYTFRKI